MSHCFCVLLVSQSKPFWSLTSDSTVTQGCAIKYKSRFCYCVGCPTYTNIRVKKQGQITSHTEPMWCHSLLRTPLFHYMFTQQRVFDAVFNVYAVVHLIFGTDLSCMSESRRKVITIWCLVLATKGTEACTAGICAGNSSGNCKWTAVFSFHSLAWHWFSLQQARGAGLIFLFFPLSSSLIQSRCELLGSGVAETRCLRPHRQLQVNSASVCELSTTVQTVFSHTCSFSLMSGCTRRRCWRVLWSGACPKDTSFRWRWSSVPDSSTIPLEKWGSNSLIVYTRSF